VVVGRDEVENRFLERYAENGRMMLTSIDVVGPITIVEGTIGERELNIAAAVTARYADHNGYETLRIKYESDKTSGILEVAPAEAGQLESWRV
jgi:hypothetical protein